MRDKVFEIFNADCIEQLHGETIFQETVDLIFADPPYNIGIDYGTGKQADSMEHPDYIRFTHRWMQGCYDALKPNGAMWVMINDEWASLVDCEATLGLGLHRRNWIKWYETFGVNCTKKFNRTSRHIFYFVKDKNDFVFNADAVRVPSARQVKYNDKRACSKGKVMDDVWEVPRVCGTHGERVAGVPTQVPLAITDRIVAACSSPGDLVLDPFCGSGTTGVSAVTAGRRFLGFEINSEYCAIAAKRIEEA